MTAAADKNPNDPLVGYFASVVLAVLCSSLWGGFLANYLKQYLTFVEPTELRQNLTAGLFFAICFSNPVGAVLNKTGIERALLRVGLGFGAGVAVQVFFLTPIGGKGMTTYLLLLIAALAVPAMLMISSVRRFLDQKKIVPADHLAIAILRVLSWPDRVLFVLLMGVSFSLFWQFSTTPTQVMVVLSGVLVALTLWVTMRDVPDMLNLTNEEIERRAWMALEPKANADNVSDAISLLKNMSHTLLPGAILFGGVMRLAVNFLFMVYPGLQIDFSDPLGATQSFGIALVSGLAVVFFGMMAALGFGLLILQIIGKVKGWSKGHLRENCVHLIRAMYFRPMDRN